MYTNLVIDGDTAAYQNDMMLRKRVADFNWRLALARVLVNAAALGLTFAILPNLTVVHSNTVLVLLLGGLIFGLLNAFIRPILQFIMFNFLFATFGLVLVLINFILLLLLDWVLDGWFEASHWYVWLFAAVLVGLFGVIFENLLGLTPPIVENHPVDAPHTMASRIEARLAQELAPAAAEAHSDNEPTEP